MSHSTGMCESDPYLHPVGKKNPGMQGGSAGVKNTRLGETGLEEFLYRKTIKNHLRATSFLWTAILCTSSTKDDSFVLHWLLLRLLPITIAQYLAKWGIGIENIPLFVWNESNFAL